MKHYVLVDCYFSLSLSLSVCLSEPLTIALVRLFVCSLNLHLPTTSSLYQSMKTSQLLRRQSCSERRFWCRHHDELVKTVHVAQYRAPVDPRIKSMTVVTVHRSTAPRIRLRAAIIRTHRRYLQQKLLWLHAKAYTTVQINIIAQ